MNWRRVESGTVDPSLAEGLQAPVADPLWLLARQWQTGEFRGDDAANPLLVRAETRSLRLERLVLPGGRSVDLAGADLPLEPLVEREQVVTGPAAAQVTVEAGRLLVRQLVRAGAPETVLHALRSSSELVLPDDDGLDPVGRRRLELLARSSIDGMRLAALLTDQPALLDAVLAPYPEQLRRRLRAAIEAWRTTVVHAFAESEGGTAWDPGRLEYRFDLAVTDDADEVRLTAGDGYAGGRLDWYAFDRLASKPATREPAGVLTRKLEVLPTPLRFRGMPAARFWEFEEGDVYFGGIETAPQDLARVAVAGYGTVYGDDFWLVPVRLPVGTLTEVTRLTVLDDFGKETTVPAAAVADARRGRRGFHFFELTGDHNPRDGHAPLLFLPPTLEVAEAGRPLEDVAFLRDENANVAWAVEQRIESAAGNAVDLAARRRQALDEPAAGDDTWRLDLATGVPDNWIPLLPVRLEGGSTPDGTIMLQRGRVPVTAAPGVTRGALGQILTPWRRLLIHEEEIPQAGIRVVRRWQSARDAAGRLHTWVGRRKGPGRGEGSSGLVFDTLRRPPSRLQ